MNQQPLRGNLSDFIKGNMGSQFVIPVYQRNYTWNPEKETAKFLSDLEDLLNHPEKTHFLGIIIYKEDVRTSMFRQLKIVDGQQRLTTSFIFLLALRKACMEKGQKDCAGMIEDYYLYNKHTLEDGRMRLKPSVSGDDVYAKISYDHISGLSQKEKESYVYRNYETILKWIRNMMKKYRGVQILDVLSRVDLLQFPLSAQDNAQQIFESINSTGAPLTSADLIRNYILMNDPNDVQERLYAMYWKPLENIFTDSKKLEEFFRFYLACKTFNLYARKDVYEGFKSYMMQKRLDSETLLKDSNRYTIYYQEIYEGPCDAVKLEKALSDFRITSSSVPAPLLMELYGMYRNKEISEKSLIEIVRLLESYLVRRVLCGLDNSQLARYFPSLLRSVIRSFRVTHQDVYHILLLNLVEYNKGKSYAMPTDEQVRNSLKDINAYALPMIRPLLERVEHYGSNVKVDTSVLNIEHIMPQHPKEDWRKSSGAQSEEEYTYLVNLIGNLTLCATIDNVHMGNEDFQYKKKILKQSGHIRLNTEVIAQKSWNKKQILKRCESMTKQILEIYVYPSEKKKNVISMVDDIVTLASPTTNARAIYHNQNDIEILPGTTLKAYGQRDMQKMKVKYDNLIARGVIQEDSNGQAHFENSEHFQSLNDAAQFLMHRGGDNSQAWHFEDGRSVNQRQTQPKQKTVQEKKQPSSKNKTAKKKQVNAKREDLSKKQISKKTQVQKKKEVPVEKKKTTPSQKRVSKNPRGFVPQKSSSQSAKQSVQVIRFAGQEEG